MKADRQEATRNAHRRLRRFQRGGIRFAIFFKQLRRRGGPIKSVRIGFVTASLDFAQFFLALQELVSWFKR
jgi:hypothetical protein